MAWITKFSLLAYVLVRFVPTVPQLTHTHLAALADAASANLGQSRPIFVNLGQSRLKLFVFGVVILFLASTLQIVAINASGAHSVSALLATRLLFSTIGGAGSFRSFVVRFLTPLSSNTHGQTSSSPQRDPLVLAVLRDCTRDRECDFLCRVPGQGRVGRGRGRSGCRGARG